MIPTEEGTGGSAEFAERVIEVVADIPAGHVMTYGDVAAAIGSRAPRAVGRVMASGHGHDLPWWRVVRASGHPVASLEQLALELLREEDTPLVTAKDGTERVDLRLARHRP